jgi:hypothetical protein
MSSKEKIERFRPQYNLWVNDYTLVLNSQEKQDLLNAVREIDPEYYQDLSCGYCVAKMLVDAFKMISK